MANDIVTETTPKSAGFVNRGVNHSKKQAAIDKEEAELAALIAEHMGTAEVEKEEVVEKETEVETKEVKTEAPEPKEEGSDDDLSREEKSFKKRYGDLRRHMADKEKEWQTKVDAASNSSSQVRAPKSDEDIEAWAAKYPDVAAIVETIASKKAEEKFSKADGRLKEFDKANYEVARAKSEMTIIGAHSDFEELRDSDTFHDWVDTQPQVVQDALYENSDDPASVIRVLDLYKVDNGMTPSARKEAAKSAAKTVAKRTRTEIDADDAGSMIKESAVAKMTDKQFEDSYDKIQEAMQSGKFVYDVSGGAR